MKKIVIMLLMSVLLVSLAFAAGDKESASTDKTYTLKLGYGGAVTNARHLTALQFAEWVKEQTNGRVTVDLYPGEMLGTDAEMAEMCSMGNLDMTVNAVGIVANYEPKIAIFELPFLFPSYEAVDRVLDSDFGLGVLDSLPAKGLRALAYWENGFRHVTNSKRLIEKPEDLKGLKIRTPENAMTLAIFNALGAKPSPLAFSELYLALSQGSFDGQENPIANIYASKLYECQKYLSITNHKYEALVFMVSENVWKKLPEDIKKVLSEGAIKFAGVHRAMVRGDEAGQIKDLAEKGMTISYPDLVPFQEATASVYSEYEKKFGKELIGKVRSMASGK
ncbi:MAG: TRAP transporter substrate-binding protein [Sphaerochaetaceae bacterium]